MLDDRYALAAITARDLATVLQTAAGRLPLTAAQGQAAAKTAYIVSALLAPAIAQAPDVAAIGGMLAGAATALRAASAPVDAAPVLYNAATASAAALPVFASPGRQRSAALASMLAECLETAWLGEAFVAEAQSSFGDQQAATAARARIAAAMDGALDRIAGAGVGQAVIGLLGQVARTASGHIAMVAANLQPLINVETARSAPSTAIAYDLYQDASRAAELVARNRCGTPLFMPTRLVALAPGA